jgi:hypothetical protein
MGKLLASEKGKANKALTYLEKAEQGRDRLSPSMATELESLIAKSRH